MDPLQLQSLAMIRHPYRASLRAAPSSTITATCDSLFHVVPYNLIEYDPNNNCTLGTGAGYTAPIAGYYLVNVNYLLNVQGTSVGQIASGLLLNGSGIRQSIRQHAFASGVNDFQSGTFATIVSMNIGDFVQATYFADPGAGSSGSTTFYTGSSDNRFGNAHWLEVSLLSLK